MVVPLIGALLVIGVAFAFHVPQAYYALGPWTPAGPGLPEFKAALNKWIEDLPPQDSRQLQTSGNVTFSHEDFKRLYPDVDKRLADFLRSDPFWKDKMAGKTVESVSVYKSSRGTSFTFRLGPNGEETICLLGYCGCC